MKVFSKFPEGLAEILVRVFNFARNRQVVSTKISIFKGYLNRVALSLRRFDNFGQKLYGRVVNLLSSAELRRFQIRSSSAKRF